MLVFRALLAPLLAVSALNSHARFWLSRQRLPLLRPAKPYPPAFA